MSACDQCPKPGACCRDIRLFFPNGDEVTTWADEPLAVYRMLAERRLPFMPSAVGDIFTAPPDADEPGREYCTWVYQCPVLGLDGRCLDYENRPALCRHLQPGESDPCVLYGVGHA